MGKGARFIYISSQQGIISFGRSEECSIEKQNIEKQVRDSNITLIMNGER